MSQSTRKDTRRRRAKRNARKQQIVPTWVLLVSPAMFIFMGYASEHYRKSRGMDPLLRRPLSRVATKVTSNIRSATTKLNYYTRRNLLTVEEDEALEKYDGKTLHLVRLDTDCLQFFCKYNITDSQ